MIFGTEVRSSEQAAVSLSDALGLQLCGLNSHNTSLCSLKTRACVVQPCTYTWCGGNNTFIPYDALGSHPPWCSRPQIGHKVLLEILHAFTQMRRNQLSISCGQKQYKSACEDTQMAIWMSDFHLGWMHSLTFASQDCAMSCKIENQHCSLFRLN